MRGTTLVELLVVLAILCLLTGVTGLALNSLKPQPSSVALRQLRAARARAIHEGHAVFVTTDSAHTIGIRFLPDGRAIGSGADPLTGAPDATP